MANGTKMKLKLVGRRIRKIQTQGPEALGHRSWFNLPSCGKFSYTTLLKIVIK